MMTVEDHFRSTYTAPYRPPTAPRPWDYEGDRSLYRRPLGGTDDAYVQAGSGSDPSALIAAINGIIASLNAATVECIDSGVQLEIPDIPDPL